MVVFTVIFGRIAALPSGGAPYALMVFLWGGDAISVSGFLWSLAGGILGIWIGYRFGQSY